MAITIRRMKKPLPPSRTAPQFVVRFPDEGMRDKIADAAKRNKRSMNAEIVARLEESLSHTLIDTVAGAGGVIGLELAQQIQHIDSLSRMIVQRLTKANDALDDDQETPPKK